MARFVAVFLLSLVAGGSCITLDTDTQAAFDARAQLHAEQRIEDATHLLAGQLGWNFMDTFAVPSATLLGSVLKMMDNCCNYEDDYRRFYTRLFPALLGFPTMNTGAISEMSVFQTSSNGSQILRTRRCAGANCSTATQIDLDAKDSMTEQPKFYGDEYPTQLFDEYLTNTYQQIENVKKNWRMNALDKLLNRLGSLAKDTATDTASFWNGLDEKTAVDFVSTQTTIEEGKLVQVQKTCENGKCTTQREERSISEIPLLGASSDNTKQMMLVQTGPAQDNDAAIIFDSE